MTLQGKRRKRRKEKRRKKETLDAKHGWYITFEGMEKNIQFTLGIDLKWKGSKLCLNKSFYCTLTSKRIDLLECKVSHCIISWSSQLCEWECESRRGWWGTTRRAQNEENAVRIHQKFWSETHGGWLWKLPFHFSIAVLKDICSLYSCSLNIHKHVSGVKELYNLTRSTNAENNPWQLFDRISLYFDGPL